MKPAAFVQLHDCALRLILAGSNLRTVAVVDDLLAIALFCRIQPRERGPTRNLPVSRHPWRIAPANPVRFLAVPAIGLPARLRPSESVSRGVQPV